MGKKLKSHKKDKGGRPTKLTKELQKDICNAIRRGLYVETACAMYDIHKANYYEWLKKGSKGKKGNIYREFRDAVERSMAEAEARDVQMMDFFAYGSKEYDLEPTWSALAWKMERKYPSHWGRKEIIKFTDQKDDAKEFHSDEELHNELVAAIARKEQNGEKKD